MALIELHKLARVNHGKSYTGVRLSPRAKGKRLGIRFGTDIAPIFSGKDRLALLYDDETRVMTVKVSDVGFKYYKRSKGKTFQELDIVYYPVLPKLKGAKLVKPSTVGKDFIEFKFPQAEQ